MTRSERRFAERLEAKLESFLPNEHGPELDQVRLAYVAMTRATERLIVTCRRESAFVKRLRAAGARAD
jgi:superfamily I DNA/RNA helicase